ncbi:MAG TPA: cobalamin biosynthesis protein CobW, partial [Rhodospirillales bacterium]
GAGKTTLIRHLLQNANGARLALIINEFGDLGIDRELIVGCGIEGCDEDDVVELANGCICCTVADDFLPTIESLLDRARPPDHIVIEASGLALPKPLVKAFNWPEVRSRVTVDGVIAVIDAPAVAEGRFADDPDAVNRTRALDPALDHDQPLREVFEDQLLAADLVLLNKSDLVDGAALERVKRSIATVLPPAVKMVTSVKGGLDPRVALGIGAAAEDSIDSRRSHHDGEADHDHDDFESFVVRFGPVADPAQVEQRVKAAARDFDVLRVKGFLDVEARDMRHVLQAVGPRVERYYDRPWKKADVRGSQLVVIGERGLDRAAIESLLKG